MDGGQGFCHVGVNLMGSQVHGVVIAWGHDCVSVCGAGSVRVEYSGAHYTYHARRELILSYVSKTSISPAHIAELLSHGRPHIAKDPEVLASVIAVLCTDSSYHFAARTLSECALGNVSDPPRDKQAWTELVKSDPVAKVLSKDIDPLLSPLGKELLFVQASSSVHGVCTSLPPVTRVEVSNTGLGTARRVASVVDTLPTTTDNVIMFWVDGNPTTAGLDLSNGLARPVLVDSMGRITEYLELPEKQTRYDSEEQGCPIPHSDELASSPEAGAALADVITVALAARE